MISRRGCLLSVTAETELGLSIVSGHEPSDIVEGHYRHFLCFSQANGVLGYYARSLEYLVILVNKNLA
jgi:hypothetical protein